MVYRQQDTWVSSPIKTTNLALLRRLRQERREKAKILLEFLILKNISWMSDGSILSILITSLCHKLFCYLSCKFHRKLSTNVIISYNLRLLPPAPIWLLKVSSIVPEQKLNWIALGNPCTVVLFTEKILNNSKKWFWVNEMHIFGFPIKF